MRSSNKFLTDNRFICHAKWSDARAPFMLWPSIWVVWGQEVAVGVRVNRWTFGLARWRFQLDWGHWVRPDPKAPIDWTKSGLEGFLSWGQQLFDQKWNRSDLDRLFRSRPEWRRLVALGGANSHYVRLLLARELFQEPEAKPVEEGLSALEAALDLDETELEDATWTISQRDTTRTTVGPGTAATPKRHLED